MQKSELSSLSLCTDCFLITFLLLHHAKHSVIFFFHRSINVFNFTSYLFNREAAREREVNCKKTKKQRPAEYFIQWKIIKNSLFASPLSLGGFLSLFPFMCVQMCYVIHLKTQRTHTKNTYRKRNGIIVIEINRESGNWLFLHFALVFRKK